MDSPRDPYRALVSELMLQQTQASRVAERFDRFIARFPDVRALAAASEDEVLAEWSGLGFYRRARSLRAAARDIVDHHAGEVLSDPKLLEALPGVGRYTAGAIASIVFGLPAPIVDGNVSRVLLRLHGRDAAADDRDAVRWAWTRATQLVEAAANPGVFNEAMMELGATVCTPRNPDCNACPLRKNCTAHREGTTDSIPRPKRAPNRRDVFSASAVAIDPRSRLLVEQRPPGGMWHGLWQAPTLERSDRPASTAEVKAALNLGSARKIHAFTHQTTHRTVHFTVYAASGGRAGRGRVWKSRRQVAELALSSPQRKILLGDPSKTPESRIL